MLYSINWLGTKYREQLCLSINIDCQHCWVDGDHIATVHCSPGSQHHVWIEWWYLCPLRGALSYCIVVVDMHCQSITRCLPDLYIVHIAESMEILSPLNIVAMDRSVYIEWSDSCHIPFRLGNWIVMEDHCQSISVFPISVISSLPSRYGSDRH